MAFNKIETLTPDESIIQMLLDIYAEKTSLPVALYQPHTNKFIWSTANTGHYSPLCFKLNNQFKTNIDSLCEQDHIKRCCSLNVTEGPKLCYMGLWNIALPIKVEDKVVGILLTGQRRLKDKKKDEESIRIFNEFLRSLKSTTNQAELIELEKLFTETPVIASEDFDTHLLESLKNIHKYLYTWILKQSEEDIRNRNKIQKLAHEFLLPIQAIVADAENLFNEIENKNLKDTAEDILQEMQKLANIAENMRGALIEAKGQQYSFSMRGLYPRLNESVELFQKEANKKGVKINRPHTLDNEKFPKIEMSIDHLNRAFKNLIHNAVKYSYTSIHETERYVDIVGNSFEKYYCVSISNFGVGILPEEISNGKIFEDGYRGLLSRDRNRTGSGMGLSEAKKVIEKHKGRIEIISEFKGNIETLAEKEGPYKTTVKVYLPYKQ